MARPHRKPDPAMMIPLLRRQAILVGALALCSPCGLAQTAADLLLMNGHIVTLDDDQPECSAIAMGGGRILALGSADELAGYVGAGTQVIDLGGRLATPGFIEGHAHFLGIGDARMQLDLMHEMIQGLALSPSQRSELRRLELVFVP